MPADPQLMVAMVNSVVAASLAWPASMKDAESSSSMNGNVSRSGSSSTTSAKIVVAVRARTPRANKETCKAESTLRRALALEQVVVSGSKAVVALASRAVVALASKAVVALASKAVEDSVSNNRNNLAVAVALATKAPRNPGESPV